MSGLLRKALKHIFLSLFASFLLQAYALTQPDEKLFKEAKILIFDKEWKSAQEKLEKLLKKYPDSPWFSEAVFYRAKSLEEQEGKELEALNAYMSYIELKDRSKSLTEESESSIIDLTYGLYEKGKKSYLREIEKRISSSNKVIKYYVAFKLSYVKAKKIAARGIPVLKEIIKKERDDELRERAKIALFRIDPKALKDFEEQRYEKKAKILKIRVWEKGEKSPTLKINIPWALADLALGAISEEEKVLMREKGYDLDRILKELAEFKGNIIEIEGEDTIIKIWID